jgi:putative sugar O-methyltransferase
MAEKSPAFHNYLEVRDRVLNMLEKTQNSHAQASYYWQAELAGFEYMLDASPLIIQKLREHCYHITGLSSYDYRSHHAYLQEGFAQKLKQLQQVDRNDLLVAESPELGGFGYMIDGSLYNTDTLKFYESLIALEKAGMLSRFRSREMSKKMVLEIGAGWGGLAYQFKTLFPNICYVIVDLPQTILFSGVYLKTLFPQASILIWEDKYSDNILESYQDYDFIFIPHFCWDTLYLPPLDLAINMVSFQEMTSEQVTNYTRKLFECKCKNLYSLNRDRSRYNEELTAVSSILENYYHLTEIKVLDVPYTTIDNTSTSKANKPEKAQIEQELASTTDPSRRMKLEKKLSKLLDKKNYHYRHLMGMIKER